MYVVDRFLTWRNEEHDASAVSCAHCIVAMTHNGRKVYTHIVVCTGEKYQPCNKYCCIVS